MASVNPSYARFLGMKLSFLEEQRDAFVNDVDQILNDGRAWIKGQNERGISYSEMNRRIDEVVNFIASRHEQIDSEVEATPDTFSSQKEVSPGPECQSQTQTETMESVRPTLPNVPEHSQGKSHGLDHIKQMLNRIHIIEESVSSLHTATARFVQAQTQVEKQMEEISQKQSIIEENQTKHLAEAEKKLKKATKQEKRVSGLEKDMEAMKQQDKRLSTLETQIQGMKQQEKRLGSVEKEMEAMSAKQSDLEKRTFVKISNVEKQIETNIDKTEAHDSSIQELSSKLQVTDTTVQKISDTMTENKTIQEEMEVKTQKLRKRVGICQKKTEKELKEVQTQYKMVCAMVANRLLPLERLRRILNMKVKNREDNVEKLHKVAENLGTLTDRVDSLEKKSSQPIQRVGFTAYLEDQVTVPEKGTVLTCFTDIVTNSGSHFDPSTGKFTAPVDGLYLVSFTLGQMNDGKVDLAIYQKLVNPGTYPEEDQFICCASTFAANTCDIGVVVVEMSAGDLLYVEADESEGDVELGRYSCFSCILIS